MSAAPENLPRPLTPGMPPPVLPMADAAPAIPFLEIEALRAQQFIPAAKEALGAMIAEQGRDRLTRPVFNWAGRPRRCPT